MLKWTDTSYRKRGLEAFLNIEEGPTLKINLYVYVGDLTETQTNPRSFSLFFYYETII